jgi:hypothetical protein
MMSAVSQVAKNNQAASKLPEFVGKAAAEEEETKEQQQQHDVHHVTDRQAPCHNQA